MLTHSRSKESQISSRMSNGTNYLVTTLSCNAFTAVDVDTVTFKFLIAAVGLLEFVTAVACDLRISSNLVDGPIGCDSMCHVRRNKLYFFSTSFGVRSRLHLQGAIGWKEGAQSCGRVFELYVHRAR